MIITHRAKESELAATVDALSKLDAILEVNSVIRIEGMDV